MKLRQLFDRETSSYTYLLWDDKSREAVIIDSVKEQVERDIQLIRELDLKLRYCLETHIHADHVTGAGRLRETLGAEIAVHRKGQAKCADLWLEDGDLIRFGKHTLQVLYTPGHTDTDICYSAEGLIFTGDTLLIRGSGRTDFQSGDAGQAFDSIVGRIFTLPDETLIYPAHDYHGFTQSTVGEEKRFNPRLKAQSREIYVRIMQSMDLPKPQRIDIAVPGNLACGL